MYQTPDCARMASSLGRGCRLALALALAWLGPSGPHQAAADDSTADDAPLLVAVLPFAAADERMTMYGKPIADAVARALTPRVANAGIEVRAISLSGAVPRRVRLVIDGRIVSRGKGKLALEAQVRDPERGVLLARVSGAVGELTDVDRLARSLGDGLTARVLSAARQTRRRADARRTGSSVSTAPADAIAASGAESAGDDPSMHGNRPNLPAPSSVRANRPVMVIFTPTGKAAGGSIEVADLALGAAKNLAYELGYRPVVSDMSGLIDRGPAVAELTRFKARRGLMLDIGKVQFKWRGVLTARGTFRARLLDASGKTLATAAKRTATLVGARGDRHRAVVRLVVTQIGDIMRAKMAQWTYRPPPPRPKTDQSPERGASGAAN